MMIYIATATLTQTMNILFARVESVANELHELQEEMKRIELKRKQERDDKAKERQKPKMNGSVHHNNGNNVKSSSSKPSIPPKTEKIENRQQSQESNTSNNNKDDEYIMVNPPISSVIV